MTFGVLSLYGYFTDSDLRSWGGKLFAELTAYDTQKIKQMGEAMANDNAQSLSRIAIIGALTLYLDFINLFVMMLEFFGNRRN